MAITLDLIERELRAVMPKIVDAEFMSKASREYIALVRISVILANCKREVLKKMECSRFKFRVWDKKNSEYVPEGKMCDVHCLLHRDGTLDCGVAYDDGYAGGIDWVKTEDAVIEQCTGLTDKNGKLIYEGDVVRLSLDGTANFDREVYYCEYNCKWFMRFCCSFKWGKEYQYYEFNAEKTIDLEIIGNIHETMSKKCIWAVEKSI